MNRVVFAALTMTIFVIPWEDSVVIPGVGSIVRLFGMAVALVGGVTVLSRGTVRRPHAFQIVAGAFLLWSALTLLWTIDFEATWARVLTYGQVIAMSWLIWEFATTESRQRVLLQAYVAGAFVPAVDVVRNWLSGSVWLQMRFSASGFNPNEVAMVLVLGIPIAWYLGTVASRRVVALLNYSYVPLAMFAMLLTASRGAFLASAIALALIPWSLPRSSVRTQLGIVVVLLSSLVVAGSLVPEASRARLLETADNLERGDLSKRETIWSAGLEIFIRHPVIGTGAGTFDEAAEPFLGDRVSPHQTFLSVLTGQGIVGLALFLSVMIAPLLRIRRMRGVQRKFWIVLAVTLIVGTIPRTWDYSKVLWFALSVLTAQSAIAVRRESQAALIVAPGSPPRDLSLEPSVGAGARG